MKVMIQWFTIHNLPFYQIVQELFSSLISHKKQTSFFFFFLVFNIEKECFFSDWRQTNTSPITKK